MRDGKPWDASTVAPPSAMPVNLHLQAGLRACERNDDSLDAKPSHAKGAQWLENRS